VNIFVDESGSFVASDKPESWNVVVGVATSESSRRKLTASLNALRASAGANPNEEVKLGRIDERQLLQFLTSLQQPGLVLFAVATDTGENTLDRVCEHQAAHVADTRSAVAEMHFDGGKKALADLANRIESLPAQLYVQLICQVGLFEDIISRSINYFVQRQPKTLREFRWRIDQKNSLKPTFEETFIQVAPALLQTRSISEPMMFIRQFDYSEMNAYEFKDGEAPDYLQKDYGLPEMEGFNVQKLLRGNVQFPDSKDSDGVQVADLVASSLRRLLRNNFDDADAIAQALGPSMLENQRGKLPILLTGFAGEDRPVGKHVTHVLRIFENQCKALFVRR
jgi:hypothetical protein